MHVALHKSRHTGRLLFILATSCLCVCLLIFNALNFFPSSEKLSFFDLTRFGCAACSALVYQIVGSMVWLFARQRLVALLLFCFSLAMMALFATQTASEAHQWLFTVLTGISRVSALTAFTLLLLIFPYNYVQIFQRRQEGKSRSVLTAVWWPIAYILLHVLSACLIIADTLARNALMIALPAWTDLLVNLYYLLALGCILLQIIGAYYLSSDLRTRQQLFIFVIGVVLAVAPLLFLTVLPMVLNFPPRYIIDARLSALPLLLLPLALGYAILRYQILVFDRYIRQIVSWTVGVIALVLLSYTVVLLSRLVFTIPGAWLAHIICVVACMALCAPFIWWLSHVVTERLFFPEIRYYRQHMQRPDLLTRETVDLNEAAELCMLAAMQAFETQEVCIYILDEGTGCYRLARMRETFRIWGGLNDRLLWHLANFPGLFANGDVEILDAQHAVIRRLVRAHRPLFLYEVLDEDPSALNGLSRFLVTRAQEKVNPLLVPVRSQGKMIGVLCLGERGDGHPYAGPDFEIIHLLLSHFSSILETARLYVQSSRHVAVLNALYSASARLERTYLSIDEVASAYATVVAEAMQVAAEIWLYIPERVVLRRVVHVGQGPYLLQQEWISQLQEQDWSACFQESSNSVSGAFLPRPGLTPTCLAQMPADIPFAWLPLCKGQRRMGVLVLAFPHPHVFAVEEKRVLGMFARQCAAALENAQITIALRAAYERQKELDQLKDQFIMTASHELRTPLTAVQGYIDLLSQFNEEIPAETRREFMQKAHRSCDELALLVGNIMDASRLQMEGERIHLMPVDLVSCVRQVIEIVEAVIKREQRQVHLHIPAGLFVQADDLRLRQILLNLVSNALKYSPVHTPLYIQAYQGQGLIKISVRDYGLGIPQEDQERLFERFVRLERDMNSPVRGTGLGLYVARRLVQAMNGRMWVTSNGIPGEGSTFSFTLQRAAAPQAQSKGSAPLLARQSK